MVDIVCLGELLIDFVSLESGVLLEQAPAFQKAPGGAPANVAVGLSKLGHEVGFIGKVGDESFGHFLSNVLQENRVDISGLSFDSETRTMLAFVSLTSEGERDFMFYRHPSADMRLTPEDIPEDLIQRAAIFHYGSISLISEPCRSATYYALNIARESSLLISYDPNLRLGLWESEERAKQEILAGMCSADLVKINDDELEFLTGTRKLENGAKQLLTFGPKLIVITLGSEGSFFYTDIAAGHVPGNALKAVDTTGAGDGFVAGLLSGLLAYSEPGETYAFPGKAELEACCRVANAVGALTTTKRGAIPALPTRDQVEKFLHRKK
jgi:fructokinase